MKKITILLLSGVVLISFSRCSAPSPESYLKNAETRGKVISNLLNDHSYMTELRDSMMRNEHSLQMMGEHHGMMGKMMSGAGMKEMMMKDTMMCNKMMGNMMEVMEKDSNSCMKMCGMMMGNAETKKSMHKMMMQNEMSGMDHTMTKEQKHKHEH